MEGKPKKRNHFSKEEDEKLQQLVQIYGESDWSKVASEMPNRSVRQVRERWQNNLSSNIQKRKWTSEEDNLLKIKVQEIGPKWKQMEQFFPGRTSYNIRNRWNCIRVPYTAYPNWDNYINQDFVIPIKPVKQIKKFIIPSIKIIAGDSEKYVFDETHLTNPIHPPQQTV